MEYINPLGNDRVSRLLVRFSVPAIVGMVVNALYNVVDRIFIGNQRRRILGKVHERDRRFRFV
jgi:Na+-driven multidrug efflux pump